MTPSSERRRQYICHKANTVIINQRRRQYAISMQYAVSNRLIMKITC